MEGRRLACMEGGLGGGLDGGQALVCGWKVFGWS